jgi:hypothetical protein
MAAAVGFEPTLVDSESTALPDLAMRQLTTEMAAPTGFEPVIPGSKPGALPTWLRGYKKSN